MRWLGLRGRRAPGRGRGQCRASSWRTPAARRWHDIFVSLPLARRPRQPDPLGRAPDTSPPPRSPASARAPRPQCSDRSRRVATGSPSISCSRVATGSPRSATSCSAWRSRSASVTHPAASPTSHPRSSPPRTGTSSTRAAHEEGYAAVGGSLDAGRSRELRRVRPGRRPEPRLRRAARLPVSPPPARAELHRRGPAGVAAGDGGALATSRRSTTRGSEPDCDGSGGAHDAGRSRGRRGLVGEPWVPPRFQSSTAIWSSTRLNTHAPSASAIAASASTYSTSHAFGRLP